MNCHFSGYSNKCYTHFFVFTKVVNVFTKVVKKFWRSWGWAGAGCPVLSRDVRFLCSVFITGRDINPPSYKPNPHTAKLTTFEPPWLCRIFQGSLTVIHISNTSPQSRKNNLPPFKVVHYLSWLTLRDVLRNASMVTLVRSTSIFACLYANLCVCAKRSWRNPFDLLLGVRA